jgi:hypothetical protein
MANFKVLKILLGHDYPLSAVAPVQEFCQKASLMALQRSIKLCWILHCSTTSLLGLAGQITEICGPDKNCWFYFQFFGVYMHRRVAHLPGKNHPHGRPVHRGASRRSVFSPNLLWALSSNNSLFDDTVPSNNHFLISVYTWLGVCIPLCGPRACGMVANDILRAARVLSKAKLNNHINLVHTWPPVYTPL